MASALLANTSASKPWDQNGSAALATAGSRVWALVGTGNVNPGGTPNSGSASAGVNLWYSDDSGATWTYHCNISTSSLVGTLVAYNNAGTWRLHCFVFSQSSTTAALSIRSIHSNVASGTPGAPTTAVNVDAGGTDAGVTGCGAWVTNTATNPRVWVIFRKSTGVGTSDTRAAFCAVGTAPDTAANWSTTNFTGLTTSDGNNSKWGLGVSLNIGGNPRCVMVMSNPANGTNRTRSYVFDPTAATPTPGSASDFAGTGNWEGLTEGPTMALAAVNDYVVFGKRGAVGGTSWEWYKSTDGATWTQPTGWTALSMGRAHLCSDGTDFFVVHSGSTALAAATTADTLSYRKIIKATDTMGSPSTFSDTSGNLVNSTVAGVNLVAIYRAGTAVNYPVRADSVTVGAQATPSDLPPRRPDRGLILFPDRF